MVLGSDSIFHFNRFFDTAEQIANKNFNYFQANYGFQQAGRIITPLYGPFVSYLMGLLLMLLGSWLKFQLAVDLLILVTAAYGVYSLSKRLHSNQDFAIISGILFMTSISITGWVLNQHFTSFGLVLIPYILKYAVDFLDDTNKVNIIGLGISMALLIQTHFLSVIFTTIALLFLFIIGFISSTKKIALLVRVFAAALLAFILTLNVWGGLFEVYSGNHLLSTWPTMNIDAAAIKLSFQSETETQLGIVLSVLFLAQIIYTIIHFKQTSKNNQVFTLIGIFFLVLSSRLMLWNALSKSIPQLTTLLQFPSRMRGVAAIFLLVALSISCTELLNKHNSFIPVIRGSLILGICFTTFNAYVNVSDLASIWHSDQPISATNAITNQKKISADKVRRAFRSNNLSDGVKIVEKSTPDYLPTYTRIDAQHYLKMHPYSLVEKNIINKKQFNKQVINNGTLKLTWHSHNNKSVYLPIVTYQHSQVKLNGTTTTHLKTNAIGNPLVFAKRGTNTVLLNYQMSALTHDSIILSICAWILTLISTVIFKIRFHKHSS